MSSADLFALFALGPDKPGTGGADGGEHRDRVEKLRQQLVNGSDASCFQLRPSEPSLRSGGRHQELPSDELYLGLEDWPHILVAIHANHGSSNENEVAPGNGVKCFNTSLLRVTSTCEIIRRRQNGVPRLLEKSALTSGPG
ncbi:hypothetical protein CCHR01_15199 [Colletotrichum chrysophilum]|uniref:Uncharacterized protein n=1 Tax=Colletotrichum chrysophilum TaxID=1836956 RepID=A0AAD9A639_9PEZI|nr:hypothetical protein K456DRAFT_42517 [Colletotrichum gloeosporioides 23]KAK1842186.1 hypothetical protein CCHR01_15199 [Colletotrichum chrysophilum]